MRASATAAAACTFLPGEDWESGGGTCAGTALAPPPPPSFLQYLLLSRGLLILLSVPVASLVTHVITANHQRSLAAGGRLKEEGDIAAAAATGDCQKQGNSSASSSRGETQLLLARPLSTFGIPLGFLDPCFALASRCNARAADLVTSATVVKVVCLPLSCFYFFRVLMSRVGLKVRATGLKCLGLDSRCVQHFDT